MSSRIELQPAYVLHAQPFQNTSLLLDFFCLDYGRVRAVARGARRPRSRNRSALQPFQPLLVSLAGRGEVKTLHAAEASVAALNLTGMRLFSGLYMNELLARLLQFHESHSSLYQSYQQSLMNLLHSEDIAGVLRRFELDLLRELGYALDLQFEADGQSLIQPERHYQFIADTGFQPIVPGPRSPAAASSIFSGQELIALRQSDFSNRSVASAAKRLLRLALQVHLGDRPLLSQQFFLPASLSARADKG